MTRSGHWVTGPISWVASSTPILLKSGCIYWTRQVLRPGPGQPRPTGWSGLGLKTLLDAFVKN